ncbi:UNKNOWN [Stylonychia lemnae]|uniref:Uncharacterized protein n=1 Tax=Stylonychia lemnae TaxID=5949 RepID=A0A077ZQ76_STYLE|nr:UNKNOWN [Stylonychia lemnae]|eukprot:CDW71535.1 UNKNOWN [Stylonychia lemnae]
MLDSVISEDSFDCEIEIDQDVWKSKQKAYDSIIRLLRPNEQLQTIQTALLIVEYFFLSDHYQRDYQRFIDFIPVIGATAFYISSKYWDVKAISLSRLSKRKVIQG